MKNRSRKEVRRRRKEGEIVERSNSKIGLKQKEGIVVEVLLNSGATELVISKEFVRKHRFRRIKLKRPIYVRNIDGILNYIGPIVDTVEVEIFFKGYKKRTLIDVIKGQKWRVILDML